MCRYVIQYDGPDIPGLLNATSSTLYDAEFTIDDISMATGGGVHTTFLTCRRQDNGDVRSEHRDRFFLERELQARLERHYKQHYESIDSVADRAPNIKVWPIPELRGIHWTLYLRISFIDKPGFVANLTEMLRPLFTLDDAFLRPPERHGVAGGANDRRQEIVMRVSRIRDHQVRVPATLETDRQLDTLRDTMMKLDKLLEEDASREEITQLGNCLRAALSTTLLAWTDRSKAGGGRDLRSIYNNTIETATLSWTVCDGKTTSVRLRGTDAPTAPQRSERREGKNSR